MILNLWSRFCSGQAKTEMYRPVALVNVEPGVWNWHQRCCKALQGVLFVWSQEMRKSTVPSNRVELILTKEGKEGSTGPQSLEVCRYVRFVGGCFATPSCPARRLESCTLRTLTYFMLASCNSLCNSWQGRQSQPDGIAFNSVISACRRGGYRMIFMQLADQTLRTAWFVSSKLPKELSHVSFQGPRGSLQKPKQYSGIKNRTS